MNSTHKHISKFLSYVLRHHPEDIGLEVDGRGWAHLPTLIEKAQRADKNISRSMIIKIIENSEKQRFSLSDDGQYIRAGYGHSIDVDLNLESRQPPDVLYHGTAKRNLSSIKNTGLHPQNRKLVHLSPTPTDARAVGGRHGKPVVLQIAARQLYEDGNAFYQSDSEPDIWLTATVPADYISEQPT